VQTRAGRPVWRDALQSFLSAHDPAAAAKAGSSTAQDGVGSTDGSPAVKGPRLADQYIYICGPQAMSAAVHQELAVQVQANKRAVHVEDINYAI
jgi:ferredoxin-NADP reductase